jgi:hypothetical protein
MSGRQTVFWGAVFPVSNSLKSVGPENTCLYKVDTIKENSDNVMDVCVNSGVSASKFRVTRGITWKVPYLLIVFFSHYR